MRSLWFGAAAAGVLLVVSKMAITAQQPAVPAPASPPPPIPKVMAATASPDNDETADVDSLEPCHLVFCADDPRKSLVLRADDSVVVDARSLTVDVQQIGKTPRVTCRLYAGPFSPTRPAVKEWRLATLRFATPEEFQKLVDKADTEQFNGRAVKPAGDAVEKQKDEKKGG